MYSKIRKGVYSEETITNGSHRQIPGTHCADGKKGSKNEGIEPEELGALKGELCIEYYWGCFKRCPSKKKNMETSVECRLFGSLL